MSVFQLKPANPKQLDVMRTAALDAENLAAFANQHLKKGRYAALFATKLEEAMLFFNKAVTHDGLIDNGDSDGA